MFHIRRIILFAFIITVIGSLLTYKIVVEAYEEGLYTYEKTNF